MAVKTVQYIFNGTTYTLTKNTSTGKYEATVTAPVVLFTDRPCSWRHGQGNG